MSDYTDPAIRITLLPRDTNSRGTIFGGVILSYIDTAGAIQAHRHTRMERFVTVAMREVIFHKPVYVGDLVSFYAEIITVGKTSITVRVIVEVERLGKSERVRVTEAEVIYVAVDEKGIKTPIITTALDRSHLNLSFSLHPAQGHNCLSEARVLLRVRSAWQRPCISCGFRRPVRG
jgi:acyl-CoA thioesterase YciA